MLEFHDPCHWVSTYYNQQVAEGGHIGKLLVLIGLDLGDDQFSQIYSVHCTLIDFPVCAGPVQGTVRGRDGGGGGV